MKNIFMSGISARVKRWSIPMFLMVTGMLVIGMASPASASTSSITPMATCFPSNGELKGPVSPAVNTLAGAVGGMIPLIVMVALIVTVLVGIIAVARKQDLSVIFQIMAGIVAVPFIAVFAMIIFSALWTAFNNGC